MFDVSRSLNVLVEVYCVQWVRVTFEQEALLVLPHLNFQGKYVFFLELTSLRLMRSFKEHGKSKTPCAGSPGFLQQQEGELLILPLTGVEEFPAQGGRL